MTCYYTLTLHCHFKATKAELATLESNLNWAAEHAVDNGMLTEDCPTAELTECTHSVTRHHPPPRLTTRPRRTRTTPPLPQSAIPNPKSAIHETPPLPT